MSEKNNNDKLTNKQEQFIECYLTNKLNGKQAALACGYSERSAESQASRLLKKDKVKKRISERLRDILDKSDEKIVRIIRELEEIAFIDITNYIDFESGDFNIKSLDDMTGPTSAIMEVSKFETETTKGDITTVRKKTKLKMYNKLEAIKLLGEYYKIWTTVISFDEEPITKINVIINKSGDKK